MKKPKLKGPLYGYLGHFKQDRFVRQGHNDSPWPSEEEERSIQRQDEEMEKEAFDSADSETDQKLRHDLRSVAEDVRRDAREADSENEFAVKTGQYEREARGRKGPDVEWKKKD